MNMNPSESTAQASQPTLQDTEVDEFRDSEQFLRSIFDSVQTSIFVVDVLQDGDFRFLALNPIYEKFIGITSQEIQGKQPEDVFSCADAAMVRKHYSDCVRYGRTISYEECLEFQGQQTWWNTTLAPLYDGRGKIYRLVGNSCNITEDKLASQTLRRQAEREQILNALSRRIRHSLDLHNLLNQSVAEIRQYLQTDRVLVYRFQGKIDGVVISESVSQFCQPLLNKVIKDECFEDKYVEPYKRGHIQVVDDISAAGLHPCQIELLTALQVKATIVVPILREHELWGLLVAQDCQQSHHWQQTEIDLLKQLATLMSIAVQQEFLEQKLLKVSSQLELYQRCGISEYQQALNFESMLRRITEKIRDSLDESQILQIATVELAEILNIQRCKIELYQNNYTQTIVAYEYSTEAYSCLGLTRQISDFPELYNRLLNKETLQFVELQPLLNLNLNNATRLACPIYDETTIFGNIWLLRGQEEAFSDFEVMLVQQVASDCAIAIRQARLYQASLAQVRELERLDSLKNDFLKTLSHELRTPITSISLALQTLETLLKREGIFNKQYSQVARLIEILRSECQRETKLINDLLTLTYLDAQSEPLTLIVVDLQIWISAIVESFRGRIHKQQQDLKVFISPDIPAIETDITDLERIIRELLNNACKFTPVGEKISVCVNLDADAVKIDVTNGSTIAPEELSFIFDPFYRIPSNDPWLHGGTGLGLALVKKLVQHLGATIEVQSNVDSTTFTVRLPF